MAASAALTFITSAWASPMTTRVKICGIKTGAAMTAALDGDAEYVGLVFFPKSPRNVSIAEARSLAERARGRAAIVALLVDPTDAEVVAVTSGLAPDYLQLHGHETPTRVRDIRNAGKTPIIKAISVTTKDDAACAMGYRELVEMILFDAKPPTGVSLPGGNGQSFDWMVVREMRQQFPFMLSGGLTADNVQTAIRICHPMAVDVSSGVETAPGVKDTGLIRAFIAAAKSAHRAG